MIVERYLPTVAPRNGGWGRAEAGYALVSVNPPGQQAARTSSEPRRTAWHADSIAQPLLSKTELVGHKPTDPLPLYGHT
jgi:hypothetical protein